MASETFYALSMSMSLNGNDTVHPAPTEFQTTVSFRPFPNQSSGAFYFHKSFFFSPTLLLYKPYNILFINLVSEFNVTLVKVSNDDH